MMRNFIPLLLIPVFLSCKNEKKGDSNSNINGQSLLFMIESGSLDDFNELTKRAGYICTDTTATPYFLIYRYKDTLIKGNELSCHVLKDRHLDFIKLETNDEAMFNGISKHFRNSGFITVERARDSQQLGKPQSNIEIILFISGFEKRKTYFVFVGRRPENYPVN